MMKMGTAWENGPNLDGNPPMRKWLLHNGFGAGETANHAGRDAEIKPRALGESVLPALTPR